MRRSAETVVAILVWGPMLVLAMIVYLPFAIVEAVLKDIREALR